MQRRDHYQKVRPIDYRVPQKVVLFLSPTKKHQLVAVADAVKRLAASALEHQGIAVLD